MKKALVITPTTGAPELCDCINSVASQTHTATTHLVVVDGSKYAEAADHVIHRSYPNKPGELFFRCDLPFNTGANGYYGHRIMAAFSHLTSDFDYVLFLDQDNWFEPNHIETLISKIEKNNLEWAYSLRKIYDKNQNFVCDDNCESLGKWPVWVDGKAHLIDTSSYCYTSDFLRLVGHIWDFGWGADRRFYTILKDQIKSTKYDCTGLHTLNYRLGGNEGSVPAEFFIEGNKRTLSMHKNVLPWLKRSL